MLSALEKSEKGARRMKRACDSFKLGDLVSWLILVYKVFPQMFKSDSFSCKGALVTFQLSSCVDARARASQPTRARRLCAACLSLLRPFSRASKVSFVPSVPVNGHIFPLSPLREPDIIYRTLFVSGKRGPKRWRTPCLTAHNQPCVEKVSPG